MGATTTNEAAERRRFLFEVVAVCATVVALAVSVGAVIVATQQKDLAADQLRAQRYQAVYDRLLDYDRFLVETPGILEYLRLPAHTAERRLTPKREAGLLWILDFYGYIWNQVPAILESPVPNRLRLRDYPRGAEQARRLEKTTDEDFEAWTTWSETIAGGFYTYSDDNTSAPSALCVVLRLNAKAYGGDFVYAIQVARLCPDL